MKNVLKHTFMYGLAAGTLLVLMPVYAAEVDAELDWSRRVQLSTTVTGVIAEVRVEAGDKASKGDLLLALDDRILKANVEKTTAELARSDRLFKEAGREMDRQSELYDRTVLSQHELELARIGLDDAKARLKAAEAARVKAQVDYEHSQLRAPFDAVILSRHAEVGQTIISTENPAPLIELAEAGKMIARLTVSLGVANTLKPGKSLAVIIGGRRYSGKVKMIGFEPVSEKKRRYPLTVEVNTGERVLRAGQTAKVVLP